MLSALIALILLLGIMLFQGCSPEGKGFALPEGDITEGKNSFAHLGCNECHSISDVEWFGNENNLHIPLGGGTTRLRTYGEMVTSVINPTHRVARVHKEAGTNNAGKSRMKNYNEIMTVQELVDIVTFLQSEYEIIPPDTDYYPYGY